VNVDPTTRGEDARCKIESRVPRSTNCTGRADTREKLVRTGEKLMLRDGYSATRVDDVIRKAGLSKGSFYHFLDGNECLGLAALEHYYSDRIARLAAGNHGSLGLLQEPDDLFVGEPALLHVRSFLGKRTLLTLGWHTLRGAGHAGQPGCRRRRIQSSRFERAQEANE
jgi:AcrR family transcriptional regulator